MFAESWWLAYNGCMDAHESRAVATVAPAGATTYVEAEPLPFQDSTNAHYVALRLLGVDDARLRPPRSNPSQADRTLGMALAFNELHQLLFVESVGSATAPLSHTSMSGWRTTS